MLHPSIEDVSTLVMYEYDYNKVKLRFERNRVIGCGESKVLVMMYPYNSLKYNINKDKFG